MGKDFKSISVAYGFSVDVLMYFLLCCGIYVKLKFIPETCDPVPS